MKNKAKLILLILVIITFFYNCTNGDIGKRIFGNYYLINTDTRENMALSYNDEPESSNYSFVIEPTIFEIGYNGNYIIAGQHPDDNRKITKYFILPIKPGFNWQTKNGLIGPLNLGQFNRKRKELNIESLNFKTVYDDLK